MSTSATTSNFSAIRSLLLLCDKNQQQVFPTEEKEWTAIIDAAIQHRVTKKVSQAIQKLSCEIPPHEEARLKSINKKSTVRMFAFSAEIASLCSLFEHNSITSIPLKGPVVAQQIYGDFSAKNSRDIDLLIREEDLPEVLSLLKKEGYTFCSKYDTYSRKQQSSFRKTNNQLAFIHPQKKLQLEIHWRLFSNPYLLPLSFEDLISRASNLPIGNTVVRTLSNRHLLFYLCVHGSKHQWSLLYWLVELADFIEVESFDWEETLQEAIDLGIERPLLQGIILVDLLLNQKAPTNILAFYNKKPTIQELVQSCHQTILEEDKRVLSKSVGNYWSMLSYKLKLRKENSYKLAHWNFVSPNDFALLKLPDTLFFCYFWLRPFFWCWRYIIRPSKNQ